MSEIIDAFKQNPWLAPVILLGSGIVVGILFDRVILPVFKRLAARTKWQFDDVVIDSLRGLFIVWFGILGARLAIESAHNRLNERTIDLASSSLKVFFIASITVFAARITVALMRRYTQKGQAIPGVSIITNVANAVVFTIGLLIILDALGIAITPILTALGVGGLAVALALQDTLSNLFAGIHIIASRQIKLGDYVKLDTGFEGYVADIGWRNTVIRALPNNMIIVPNSKMASAIVVNYYQPDCEMGVGVEITISCENDLEKVERITIEVAKEIIAKTPGIVDAGEPGMKYSSLTDYSITFGIGFRVKEYTDQYLVKHEFLKALQKRYKAEGIKFATPTRTIYVRQDKLS